MIHFVGTSFKGDATTTTKGQNSVRAYHKYWALGLSGAQRFCLVVHERWVISNSDEKTPAVIL